MIKQLAQPILEKIFELEEQLGSDFISSLPQIHLILDNPLMEDEMSEFGHPDELVAQLESYIQEQLEEYSKPLVLH